MTIYLNVLLLNYVQYYCTAVDTRLQRSMAYTLRTLFRTISVSFVFHIRCLYGDASEWVEEGLYIRAG